MTLVVVCVGFALNRTRVLIQQIKQMDKRKKTGFFFDCSLMISSCIDVLFCRFKKFKFSIEEMAVGSIADVFVHRCWIYNTGGINNNENKLLDVVR